ncbi:MAG TPA: PEP-CTERM sorting domain-containing protein, partial [Verrucomicrobiae bacterium]|nr:PEP-CTERM sorting domain-containing protein [Verrucomicrobiae bacterium]
TPHSASAYQIFFGEDLNNDGNVALIATPNASNAENQFLNVLSGVGTENFEGFANGVGAPLGLSFPGAANATLSGGSGAVASVTPGSTNGVGRYGTVRQQFL